MSELGPFSGGAWKGLLAWFGMFSFAGLIGRLAYHATQVRAGNRAFWSAALLLELPIAILCGAAGGALGLYLGLSVFVAFGLCSGLAFLGPRGIEVWLLRWWESKKGTKE